MKTRHYILLTFLIFILSISSCDQASYNEKIKLARQEDFDTIINNKQVKLFTLINSSGCVVQITNFGARWISMWVPDKSGKMTDVVLGFNKLRDYLSAGEPYHGAIVGRICGRINDARFYLDGIEYSLAGNDLFGVPEKNHLHGGIEGFHKQVWDARQFSNKKGESEIEFTYLSRDGEEGFPGNLKVVATYTLTDKNELQIHYMAETDKPTLVNLTNHAYFNLNGEGNGNILNHQMKIYADKYIECDHELIPTGNLKNVKGTPLDYRKFTPMGKGIEMDHNQIIKGKGYAAAMVISEKKNNKLRRVAIAYSEESGIKLELFSDKPSLQIYNAWLFNGKDTGKSGKSYQFSGGFVLEAQGYPDAPNHKNFPDIILRPGERYDHYDIYKFSITKN
jgi:aldose 1-epimerase